VTKGSLTFFRRQAVPELRLIVCHCEVVNDATVRAAVLAGAEDVAAVGERCRAGTNCGGCRPTLERLVEHHVTAIDASVAVA
jgi:NAD(P)H-nitrite reductase large subunit